MARARGINTVADVPARTIDGQDLNLLWGEFRQTLDLANSKRTAISSLFTYDTTLASDLVAQLGAGDDFEEASEFGVPTSMRTTHSEFRMGFPLRWFDKATRYTWEFLRDATADQVTTVHAQALEADNRLLYKHILSALMRNENRTNEDGVSVYSLYNGTDGMVPPEHAGNTFDASHTHYLTSQSANIDGADLRDLITHITHHGYGVEQGEQIVILMNPAQAEAVRGLRVSEGSPYDFIPSESAPAYLTTEVLVGERPPANYNGLKVIGGFGPAWIVEEHFIPRGYVLALATSGANSERNPLAFRQHVRPEYRGLRQIPGGNSNYPLAESYYSRGFGVGVRHRGAAAVMQVTASETYTAPTL